MNSNEQQQLKRELQHAGASASEIAELLPIAAKVGLLAHTKPVVTQTPHYQWHKTRWSRFVAVVGIVVAIVFALILLSQLTLPGSPLYPLQQISDNTAIALYPSYRADVMMKRARQVKLLVQRRAHPDIVLATLTDYQSIASAYRVNATNYEALEYCKDNLEQAAAMATGSERAAIDKTLSSLKDI